MAFREPIQVLVYCFRRTDDGHEYLLLKTVPKRGSFWQGVTGAIEKGENLIDAAKRELIEETGIIPEHIYQTNYSFSLPVADEWRFQYHPDVDKATEYSFLAEVKPATEPSLSFEHEEYRWVSFVEGKSLLKWSDNINALGYCEKWLETNLKKS